MFTADYYTKGQYSFTAIDSKIKKSTLSPFASVGDSTSIPEVLILGTELTKNGYKIVISSYET